MVSCCDCSAWGRGGEMGVTGVTETPPWAWGGVGRCRLRAWEQCGAVDRKGREIRSGGYRSEAKGDRINWEGWGWMRNDNEKDQLDGDLRTSGVGKWGRPRQNNVNWARPISSSGSMRGWNVGPQNRPVGMETAPARRPLRALPSSSCRPMEIATTPPLPLLRLFVLLPPYHPAS